MNIEMDSGAAPLTLLLVEDDMEDREIVLDDLVTIINPKRIVCAGRLDEALELAASRRFDLILLDLGLPDSNGLETFLKFYEKSPEVPFVVLTGQDDNEVAAQALNAGAQDYLFKGEMSRQLLSRSIRYSIERHKLLLRCESERMRRDQEREQNALESMAVPSQTSITSCMYGRGPLKERASELFKRIVQEYACLLDRAFERQIIKNQPAPGSELRKLAEELGHLCAGPREVLDVHLEALRTRCDSQPMAKVKAITEEGRFLMIELMGYLLSFYRDYYSSYARTITRVGNAEVTRENKS